MENHEDSKISRFRSLDITRGLIVILSVFLFHIPSGGYEYLRHAKWNGITIMDFILPGFITVFGVGMAFAYRRGVHWPKLIKRTIRLIFYGLIFNMIVDWKVDFSTIRLTGVLQLYAFLGILAVVISVLVKSWRKLLIVVTLFLCLHGYILVTFSQGCADGLPQMDCNPSGVIDVAIFGAEHLYYQGKVGYDPEGILTIFAALTNVLFGFIAGKILIENRVKGAWKELLILGVILMVASYFISDILPFNKKVWTPSFALITGGSIITILSFVHLFIDRFRSRKNNLLLWYIEAFGRNSFLIYFGKFVVYAILAHTIVSLGGEQDSISRLLYLKIEGFAAYPQLTYAGVMLFAWSLVAVILHLRRWYVKV